MVELADTQDLGSCAHKRAGSTPVTRTKSTCFDTSALLFSNDYNHFKQHCIKFKIMLKLHHQKPRGVYNEKFD